MSSSVSLEEALRHAVADEVDCLIREALEEQRALLQPLQDCGGILRRRAALSVREAAELLGVGESTVRAWVAAGELVPLDFSGGRILIGTDQIVSKLAAASEKRRNCGEA